MSIGITSYPTALDTAVELYTVANKGLTALTAGINSATATIPIADASKAASTGGIADINGELIQYTGVSGLNLTGATRGFDGTSAAAHLIGDPVKFVIAAQNINVKRDAIIAIETELGLLPKGTFSTVRARLDTLETLPNNTYDKGFKLDGTTSVRLNGVNTANQVSLDPDALGVLFGANAIIPWNGSASNNKTQDSITIQPNSTVLTNWRPIAIYRNNSDATPIAGFTKNGSLLIGDASSSATMQLNISTDGANVYLGPGNASIGTAFIKCNKFGGLTYDMTNTQYLDLTSNTVELKANNANGTGSPAFSLNTANTVSTSQYPILCIRNNAVDKFRVEFDGNIRVYGSIWGAQLTTGSGSDTLYRQISEIKPSWIIANNNTRTGRMQAFAYDFNNVGREGWRIDSDGTQALLSFYGATAIAKPTVTGSRGANAALASLLTALANLGLLVDSSS